MHHKKGGVNDTRLDSVGSCSISVTVCLKKEAAILFCQTLHPGIEPFPSYYKYAPNECNNVAKGEIAREL